MAVADLALRLCRRRADVTECRIRLSNHGEITDGYDADRQSIFDQGYAPYSSISHQGDCLLDCVAG